MKLTLKDMLFPWAALRKERAAHRKTQELLESWKYAPISACIQKNGSLGIYVGGGLPRLQLSIETIRAMKDGDKPRAVSSLDAIGMAHV